MTNMLELDRLDLKILAALQAQGRLSNARLGEIVGLSESACAARVRKLEGARLVVGFRAVLDHGRLRPHVVVWTWISLADDRNAALRAFEAQIEAAANVVECHYVSGEFDYLMKSVAADFDSYIGFIDDLRAANANITQYRSFISIKTIKDAPTPLDVIYGRVP